MEEESLKHVDPNELMLGSIVSVRLDNGANNVNVRFAKVVGIEEKTLKVTIGLNNPISTIDIENCYPIPITIEVIDLMNRYRTNYQPYFEYEIGKYEWRFSYSLKRKRYASKNKDCIDEIARFRYFKDSDIEHNLNMLQAPDYVHQLQIALKVLNVEDRAYWLLLA